MITNPLSTKIDTSFIILNTQVDFNIDIFCNYLIIAKSLIPVVLGKNKIQYYSYFVFSLLNDEIIYISPRDLSCKSYPPQLIPDVSLDLKSRIKFNKSIGCRIASNLHVNLGNINDYVSYQKDVLKNPNRQKYINDFTSQFLMFERINTQIFKNQHIRWLEYEKNRISSNLDKLKEKEKFYSDTLDNVEILINGI